MIYLFSFLLTLFLLRVSQYNHTQYWAYFLSVIPIILVAALRDPSIGVDTSYYVMDYFKSAVQSKNLWNSLDEIDVEELYFGFNYLISGITDDFNIYLFFAHSLMYGCAVYALFFLKDKIRIWTGGWFLCFFFYRDSLNIARQSMAECILLIAFAFISEKKYALSLPFILFAFGFHHTAIIFLFVLLLKIIISKYVHLFSSKTIKTVIILIIAIVLYSFALVASYLEGIGLMPQEYVDRYGSGDEFGTSLPIAQLSLCVVNLLVFYLTKMSQEKYKYDSLLLFYEYILIIALMTCFAGLISTLLIRIGDYFGYMSIIIFPVLYSTYRCNLFIRNMHLLFLVFYWIMTVVVANLSETYPYKSVLNFYLS